MTRSLLFKYNHNSMLFVYATHVTDFKAHWALQQTLFIEESALVTPPASHSLTPTLQSPPVISSFLHFLIGWFSSSHNELVPCQPEVTNELNLVLLACVFDALMFWHVDGGSASSDHEGWGIAGLELSRQSALQAGMRTEFRSPEAT